MTCNHWPVAVRMNIFSSVCVYMCVLKRSLSLHIFHLHGSISIRANGSAGQPSAQPSPLHTHKYRNVCVKFSEVQH